MRILIIVLLSAASLIIFLTAGCEHLNFFEAREANDSVGSEKINEVPADDDILPETEEEVFPPPQIVLEPEETLPGNHVILKAGPFREMPELELNADFTHDLSEPHLEDNFIYFFLGVNYVAQPGEYKLTLEVSEPDKDSLSIDKTIILRNPDFAFSRFSVPPTVMDDWTVEQLAKDRERIREARSQTEKVPLWSGPFIWPVEGRISSDFGAVRVINNGPPTHHSGIDIALPEGTPFVAANRGVVTLAEFLLASGNAVFIDHGVGLSSAYLHMHEIFVEEGQLVEQGDVIGTIGTTGFSSGPHLHWSVYVNNTPVSPYNFMDGLIPIFPE